MKVAGFVFLMLIPVAFAAPPAPEELDRDAPELMMQQQLVLPPPAVSVQLQRKMSDRCREKLKYYQDKIDEHDNDSDLFHSFMLKKWEDRCSDE